MNIGKGWKEMTNEEATEHITTWLYAAPDVPPMQVVQALELAVAALSAGGTDMNVPTMPGGQPLTLEQLRAELEQKSKLRKMARAIEGEIAKCTLWRQAGNRL